MSPENPPAIVKWLLEHLTFGNKNEALAGDLLEEFRRGRSGFWYLRQTLAAVILAFVRGLRARWLAAVFAVLWAVPAPGFLDLVIRRLARTPFITHRWQMNWPYSVISDIALFATCSLVCIWLGLVLYFLFSSVTKKSLNFDGFSSRLWMSALVFIGVSAVMMALLPQAPHGRYQIGVDWLYLDIQLPIFFALLVATWQRRTKIDNGVAEIAR